MGRAAQESCRAPTFSEGMGVLRALWTLQWQPSVSLSLFLTRGERAASAAESRVLGSAGGREGRAAV